MTIAPHDEAEHREVILRSSSISKNVPSSTAELESILLGRRRDGRRDAADAVGEAGVGGAETVRGVDSRGSA